MTAGELARLLGRSVDSVECYRKRHGRYRDVSRICVRCEDRVVWRESRHAARMHLCQDCYLDEMEHRERNAARTNALRQSVFKDSRRVSGGTESQA